METTIDETLQQICVTEDCYDKALFGCSKHGCVCSNCAFDFHSNCTIVQILPFGAIEQAMEKIHIMLSDIDEKVVVYDLFTVDPKFKNAKDRLNRELKNLVNKVNGIKRKRDWRRNGIMYNNILEFKNSIEKSSIITAIALYEHQERVKLVEKYGKDYRNNEEYLRSLQTKNELLHDHREQQARVKEEEDKALKVVTGQYPSEAVHDSIEQQSNEIVRLLNSGFGNNSEKSRIVKKQIQDTLNSYIQSTSFSILKSDDSLISSYCTLKINCSNSDDQLLFEELVGGTFPQLKQLSIENFMSLSSPESLNNLFKCNFDLIRFLTINPNNVNFYCFDNHIDYMESFLESVTEEIYLYCIQMSVQTLIKLISYSHNAKKISLIWCRFVLNTNEEIEFDPSIEFNTKTMSFYWSIFHGDPSHMDLPQFKKLIEALSCTSMVDSLRCIECGGHYSYNALVPTDLNPVFQEFGFNVQIHERLSQPMTNIE